MRISLQFCGAHPSASSAKGDGSHLQRTDATLHRRWRIRHGGDEITFENRRIPRVGLMEDLHRIAVSSRLSCPRRNSTQARIFAERIKRGGNTAHTFAS